MGLKILGEKDGGDVHPFQAGFFASIALLIYPLSAVVPLQSRMARAALPWSIDDLAEAAKLGRATLARLELEQTVSAQTIANARAAFERQGVVFIEQGEHGGVLVLMKGR